MSKEFEDMQCFYDTVYCYGNCCEQGRKMWEDHMAYLEECKWYDEQEEEVDEIKDSGTRREFESGAVRDMSSAEKGRYDLIPPTALRRLALVFQRGAVKYGEHNWQKGIPVSSFLDSAIRHLEKVRMGLVDEDHAAMAAWNAFALMWTLEQIEKGILPQSLDNRIYKETGDDRKG